jgi:hypothetical protein
MMQAQAARLADGTLVRVRLTADLLSSQAKTGSPVGMEIAAPVMSQGTVVIPQGSLVWGTVKSVKKGKSVQFDVEWVRLPNQEIVRLRGSPQKPKKFRVVKYKTKARSQVGADLGASKGSEFIAYLDQELDAGPADAPASPAAQAAPLEPAAPSVVSAAVSGAAAAPPLTSVSFGDYITVECFSEPTGADIMIDNEFHGSTPSILKLPPGNHRIEYRLDGYKPHSQPLILSPATGLHTVRMTLEAQP